MNKKKLITRNDFLKKLSVMLSGTAIIGLIINYGKTLSRFFNLNKIIPVDIRHINNHFYENTHFFVSKNNNKIEVLSKKCPHLGCSLQLNGDKTAIICPCHGSRFNLKGKFVSGPAKQDMKRYNYKMDSDTIINIEVEG